MAARLNLEPSWAQGLKLKLKTQVARMRGASGQAAELSLNPQLTSPTKPGPISYTLKPG